jgi:hypothetical protein
MLKKGRQPYPLAEDAASQTGSFLDIEVGSTN